METISSIISDAPRLCRSSILRRRKSGELPVQLPLKFVLVINVKTAKALGLKCLSLSKLLADQIIE